MTVIVLHQADELKLINFQKELIKNAKGGWYAHMPLWIELPDDFYAENKDDLKKLSKQISKVEAGGKCRADAKQDLIYICVTIFDKNDGKIAAKLPLLYRLDSNPEHLEKKQDNEKSIFRGFDSPVSEVKIFRLGIEKKTDDTAKSRSMNSQNALSVPVRALSDSVWVKLHNNTSAVE